MKKKRWRRSKIQVLIEHVVQQMWNIMILIPSQVLVRFVMFLQFSLVFLFHLCLSLKLFVSFHIICSTVPSLNCSRQSSDFGLSQVTCSVPTSALPSQSRQNRYEKKFQLHGSQTSISTSSVSVVIKW